jgi:hypothetical protein
LYQGTPCQHDLCIKNPFFIKCGYEQLFQCEIINQDGESLYMPKLINVLLFCNENSKRDGEGKILFHYKGEAFDSREVNN